MTTRLSERFHYRRSLASRVILLTTIAVGVAVAFLSVGAYVTVRMQLQSTLDESLLDRAHRAADSPALQRLTTDFELPSWALGAADVRIAFITSSRSVFTPDREGPPLHLGDPELAVAAGEQESSIRTITAGGTRYRVVTVPTAESGQALVIAQSLRGQEQVLEQLGVVMLLFGLAGVIAAGVAGWTVARNGLRPVRRTCIRSRSRATTRSPGSPPRSTRCSPPWPPRATGNAGWSPTPATSCAPHSPRFAPTSTCWPRPTAPPTCPRRPGPSCSPTYAPRSRS
jgi:hypothetical protein